MLTVRDNEADKVEALDAGADDYVTKPFNTPELLARIRAALRRTPWTHGPRRTSALGRSRSISTHGRSTAPAADSVRLTPKEFDLLRYLVAHANKAVTHRELLQAVWGPDYGDQVDYLRVVVNQLRKKIETNPPSRSISSPNRGSATACYRSDSPLQRSCS